jgi:hypothetical protein
VSHLVDRGPSTTFGFLVRGSAPLVALFDVFGLPLLLIRVFGFVAARHDDFLLSKIHAGKTNL